jgi:hypothetical protein
MRERIEEHRAGLLAFVMVLLFMPLGHALMVLNEKLLHGSKFTSALVMGAFGAGLLFRGIRKPMKAAYATLLGFIGGVLVWTGWVEFSFVWIAEKLRVQPLIENGEVTTKPEYLVMLSSLGLLGSMLVMFFFGPTRCTFFHRIQRMAGMRAAMKPIDAQAPARPLAAIAFMETVIIIWTFYIVLLLVYDKSIAGDRHPLAYLVAFGSLIWSAWLFLRLIRIRSFDHALRYAIPTVVIFWNFVEVTGRWDLFKEIWVHPMEHWMENSIILASLLVFVLAYIAGGGRDRQRVRLVARSAADATDRPAIPSGSQAGMEPAVRPVP